MNILFLTTVLPGERSTGGEVASQAIVDALRTANRVHVVGFARPSAPAPTHGDDHAAGTRPIETSTAGPRAAAWMAAALALRLPYSAAKYRSRAYRALAQALAREQATDMVVVDHAQAAWLDPRRWWDGPLVHVAHNAEHRMYADSAARAGGVRGLLLGREAERIRYLEGKIADAADEVWALTSTDAAALEALAGTRSRVLALPGTPAPEGPLPEPAVDVAILGLWSWAPNAEGLRWFLDRVAPLVPPDIRVSIAGAGANGLAARHPEVAFPGRVPDAQAFLRSARVVAVPSVAGGGVQVKTLDAVASGRPVVATTHAARGIDPLPASLTVADDPEQFAGALMAAAADDEGRVHAAAAAIKWSRDRREHLALQVCDAAAALARV